jgi:hypothetical protein
MDKETNNQNENQGLVSTNVEVNAAERSHNPQSFEGLQVVITSL